MERPDQSTEPRGSGRILVVGGDPERRAEISELLNNQNHRCTHVSRLDAGRAALTQHAYDVVLVHPTLPDGDGLALVRSLRDVAPLTKTIVFHERPTVEMSIAAIRSGAVDVLSLPDPSLAARVDAALINAQSERQRETRIRRLHKICRDLDTSREEISRQVDLLCSDLVTAYRELTEQMDDVAMASEFRTLLRQELGVEDVLRTALEYLLTRTGPTNAAVFLPDQQQNYSLGAYVNYDCPRESIDTVLGHLCRSICPQMASESEIIAFDDAEEFAKWIGLDDGFFADSDVIAFSCRHRGECLAVVVLFRSHSDAFAPELAATLDTLRAIFAEQLSRLIDVHHRAKPRWPGDVHDRANDEEDDDSNFGYGGLAA